ncbi:LuxR C-terminal-related transcriptional regulator [Thermopolyspora sp. NPDC052614]|uniref:LuxR C-terminal-related transcriptional regulator n=1 Tax=Thermopolyspora sp. NPDC052614 TaxID=3155682 RepID=UPI00341D57EF
MNDPIRVAVVEDHHLTREGAVRHLQADPRFTVVAEERSATALLRSRAIFDVCLLDLLTDSPAEDVMRLLRNYRIVVITARDDWQTKVGAWALGAHAVLYKSVHPNGISDALVFTHRAQPYLEPNLANALIDAARSDSISLSDTQLRLLDEIVMGHPIEIAIDIVGISADRFAAEVLVIREECRRNGLDRLNLLGIVPPVAEPHQEVAEPHQEVAKRLTKQQLRVLDMYADGYSRKEIAEAFGDLSEKTITNHIDNALDRVGITNASTEQRLLFALYVTGRLRYPERVAPMLAKLKTEN